MRELIIQPANKDGKGRSFSATMLAYVTANTLWDAGSNGGDTVRPVWMMLGGSENELRPFVANIQMGRKAEIPKAYSRRGAERFEVLKSAKFQTVWQRTPVGSVVTLFAPDIFRLDPGMVDPKGVEFCVLPDVRWLSDVQVDPKARAYLDTMNVPQDRKEELLKVAPLFIAYLDRRTRCPMVPDQRFYVQILCAALQEGLASWSKNDNYYRHSVEWGYHPKGFQEWDTDTVGLAPGVVFQASHETLEKFLAIQVKLYFNNCNPDLGR